MHFARQERQDVPASLERWLGQRGTQVWSDREGATKLQSLKMGLTIMDPTDESVAIERALAPRSPLENATIGLIDIRKARG